MKDHLLALGFMFVWALAILKAVELSDGNDFLFILLGGSVSATMIYIVLKK